MVKTFLLLYVFLQCVSGMKQIKSNVVFKHSRLNMLNNDYSEDLNLLHKYRGYFEKTNYNDVIKDLNENKISKILINTDYKQLLTVDNLPKVDSLYNHYHISDITPLVI